KFTKVDFATGLSAPQAQRVGGVGIITRDNLVIGHRQNLFGFNPAGFLAFLLNSPAETHLVARIMAFELPRIAVFQPVVRGLFLPPLDNVLLEHVVVVANSIAAPRQAQGRQRIKEARRQTAKTAVAKTG